MEEQSITVERRQGLFSTLGTPKSLNYLPAFLAEAQLSALPARGNLELFLVEAQGTFTDRARDLAKALKERLDWYDPKPVPNTEEVGQIKIAVNELHCPRVPGAKAKLTIKQRSEEKSACTVKLFGVGGGDEFVTTISTSETLETENNCVGTTHLISAVFEKCRMNTPDGGHIEFVRLKDVKPRSLMIRVDVLNPDACQLADAAEGIERVVFDIPDIDAAKLGKTLELQSGSTWSSEGTVKLEKLGVELGAKYEATRTYATEFEYSLVEGYRYVALQPSNHSSWLWKWDRQV